MIPAYFNRLAREVDLGLLARCAWTLGFGGVRSVRAFQKRLRRGRVFPAFLFLSVTNRCNLKCQGCWVTPTTPPRELEPALLDRIIGQAKREQCRFFGILGGEPLLYPRLFEILGRHQDCYFQVFTNGTTLDQEAARAMRRLGNITPLISVEGLEEVSDQRRGGTRVYRRSFQGIECCRRERLLIGVATSICKSNFRDLVSETFVRALIGYGVHYLWYYIYRPMGPDPSAELCLSADDIVALRRFIVDIRPRFPLIVVDAYWDADGRALCPAATGISHHIGPHGDLEPCPPVQFARENARDSDDTVALVERSAFLGAFRRFAASQTRGCVLLECPDALRAWMAAQGARDTTGRGTALAELAAMQCRPGHHMPGREIPESHWAYRLAKKYWFFGFGAYG
ncbi:MAG: radical SAM protein [Verrucomicrobia bacterium]|nr:radical SAM protein [Verrucomicrobiota bacterium]OQC62946.1 MAG: molybdenum cofactor biosynthesis protein A [Verrucomicrobia bacterium ADurb.Bin006]MDI9380704.1 radical SAM/SPASM domain-containing protein [Verrucomicrobiota bacterium]NMD20885.1 radical SAM protein [Verrucomicrobiota bacterium]HNU98313.1 radical SAM/SPASM domain-containing protein [Verrucomicrobiota bacterium]